MGDAVSYKKRIFDRCSEVILRDGDPVALTEVEMVLKSGGSVRVSVSDAAVSEVVTGSMVFAWLAEKAECGPYERPMLRARDVANDYAYHLHAETQSYPINLSCLPFPGSIRPLSGGDEGGVCACWARIGATHAVHSGKCGNCGNDLEPCMPWHEDQAPEGQGQLCRIS